MKPKRTGNLTDLLNSIITSRRTTLSVREAADELIAEDARFNKWVLERKPRSSTAELWNLAALADQCHADCAAAWEAFMKDRSNDRERAAEALAGRLKAVADRLRVVRESDTIDYDDPEMPDEVRDM